MAEAEVAVVARAIGFEQVAAQPRAAAEALRQLGQVSKSLKFGNTARSPIAALMQPTLAGYINSAREVLKVREEKIATIALDAECTSFSDLRVTFTLLADQRRD